MQLAFTSIVLSLEQTVQGILMIGTGVDSGIERLP